MITLLLVSFAASTRFYRFENPPPNGWWLVVEAVDTKAYLLTGESLSRFPVKLSLVNLSAEVRSYVPLEEASKGGVLALRAVQNDKIAPHVMPFPPIPPSRIGRPALGPGQVSEMTVGMRPLRIYASRDGREDSKRRPDWKRIMGQLFQHPFTFASSISPHATSS